MRQNKNQKTVILFAYAAMTLSLLGWVQAETKRPSTRVITNSKSISKDETARIPRHHFLRREVQSDRSQVIRFGKIPATGYPTAETVVVDYRDDEPSRMRLRGELVGPMPMKSIRGSSTNGAHISGGSVANGGSVAAGGCTHDIECDDGHPCTQDVCDIVTGGPVGTGICVNSVLPNGDVGECDDGLFCNGQETCQGSDGLTPGTCTAGADSCLTGESCSEDFQCHPACTLDENCDDGLGCNGLETCVSGVCVMSDNPCGPNADCAEKVCEGCGPGCNNQRVCDGDVDCISDDGLQVGTCTGGLTCYVGRCCTLLEDGVTYQCNKTKHTSCGGLWYAGDTGRAGSVFVCGPSSGGCPKYGSGIAPHGDYVTVVGPISDSAQSVPNAFGQGVGPATPLNKLGDDYQLSNHPSFMNLLYIRLVAGLGEPGFALIEIYDEHGHLIEDVLMEVADSVIAVRVIEFDPPLIIPSKGFIVLQNASNYSLDARLYWLSTDVVDVGVNDPDVLWVNGGLQGGSYASTSNFLPGPGVLAFELVGRGDVSIGGSDKVAAPLGACCDGAAGKCSRITEWECEGTGGSFVGLASACSHCGPDTFLFGTPCRTCDAASTNVDDPCNGDFDCVGGECVLNDAICKTCNIDSINAGDPCSGDGECDGGLCVGTCVPLTSCDTGACCNLNGTCDSGVIATDCIGGVCRLGANDGQACLDDLDCTEGTCVDRFQGFGTDCDANCCQQPMNQYRDPEADLNGDGVPDGPWSGGDSCEDAFVHAFTVPPPGSPPVTITISGDNSPASSTQENPDSCPLFFGNEDSDRGWWESFQIDSCAFVWIDTCCDDCEDHCRNVNPFLIQGCPCLEKIGTVELPDTYCRNCFSRGVNYRERFCGDVDDLQFFGPLRAGTYYYPVPSGVGDHIGPYQLHITVDPCPVANCCTNDGTASSVCTLESFFDCEDGGGYFHGPPFRAVAVYGCYQGFCDIGSCCTGPGQCVDRDEANDPFTISSCNTEGGKYVGGIPCEGGYCNDDPSITCNDDSDCGFDGPCMGDEAQLARPNPCPICEIAGPNNCHEFDLNSYNFLPSDLGMLGKPVVADDFIPLSDNLSSLCVWGFYLNVFDPYIDFYVPDCADDVGDLDNFRVRVYANSANDLPGELIGESLYTSTVKAKLELDTILTGFNYGRVDTYAFNMVLDPPITGLVLDGRRYWIEVTNDLYLFDDCNWWWWQLDNGSDKGNHYNATGFGGEYHSSSVNIFDQAMCLSTDFAQPFAPVNPCCRCTDGACSMETLFDCHRLEGEWMIDDTDCETVICETGPPINDSCLTPIEIPEVPYQVQFNNFCASTDGYDPVNWWPGDSIGHDVWFTYTPTEECVLIADTCAAGISFDSYIALYSFGTSECPCPQAGDLDTHLASFIEASDDGCTGEVAGGGVTKTRFTAKAGACYTIRVGGYRNTLGAGILDVSCTPLPVAPTSPLPDPAGPGAFACGGGDNYGLACETCDGGSRAGQLCLDSGDCLGGNCLPNDALCPGAICGGAGMTFPWPKSRYLGFRANEDATWVDQQIAIRVKLIDVKDHPECTDQIRWVGPPAEYCESGVCAETFQASSLQDTPYFTDWTLQGVVLIVGEEIIPESRYGLQAIDISSSDNLENEANYSNPLLLIDTGKWGDVVAPFDRFTSSSQPSIADVLAIVDKWLGNLEPRKSRSQLQPAVLNLNSSVGIADVLKAVDAWLGSPYPYPIDSCSP